MTNDLRAVAGRDVSRETVEKLQLYGTLVLQENNRQNLVSKSTLDVFWTRHVLDSAQLIRFAADGQGWADIGSGAGLPGVVIACFGVGPVTLIEPRRLRADFLQNVVDRLALDAEVHRGTAESATGAYDLITARAVASASKLFEISQHLSTGKTRYVFPKGKGAESELAEARKSWQGSFHVERSLLDEQSLIVVANDVRRKT